MNTDGSTPLADSILYLLSLLRAGSRPIDRYIDYFGESGSVAAAGLLRAKGAEKRVDRRSYAAVIHGHIANQSGSPAARIRLLVEAGEDGRVVGQRVSWLGETLTPGTRAYFTIPAPAPSPTYRVTVFDYDIRRGGG